MDLIKLQNGSDIRGIATEGVIGEEINLTTINVWQIAASFSQIISNKLNKKVKIALGRDSRISGEELLKAAASGIYFAGNICVDFQLSSTPAMFMSVIDKELGIDGAIMITASHLPYNRNGMKFFTKDGGADNKMIKEILINAETIKYSEKNESYNQCEKLDFMKIYAEGLRRYIIDRTGAQKPLLGAKIIVDAGNGSGGFFVHDFLNTLGADTNGSVFLEPDGMFPNHIPNPEDKSALKSIKEQVIKEKADLGIIFDTDVDRAALIDANGDAINRNRLIALISAIILKEHPNSTIVTDSVTSSGLKEFIEKSGGKHHRYKRGYKNVINEAIRLNSENISSYLAIETSGHGALKENYFLDDGAFLIVKLLTEYALMKKEGMALTDLLNSYKDPVEEKEIRIKIHKDNFKEIGLEIMRDLEIYADKKEGWVVEKPNFEGIRVLCDSNNGNGWFLLRLSLHDPVLPLNIESDVAGGSKIIEEELRKFLDNYSEISL